MSYGGKEKRSRWGIGLYLGLTHNYDEGLPDGSGMSREAHVPFYEGLGGSFAGLFTNSELLRGAPTKIQWFKMTAQFMFRRWNWYKVLMQAFMNREALELTVKEQKGIYCSRCCSRSRAKLWRKGESSGHVQLLKEIRLDCDGDSILTLIEQLGGMACHTGRNSCYYRTLNNGQWHRPQSLY